MRTNVLFAAEVGFTLFAGKSALAQPSYGAEDIVKHFAPPGLVATRGQCIGTDSECAKSVAPPRPTTNLAFDRVVNFDYNSDVLSAQAKQNLDQLAKGLRDARLKSASFLVEGHTDVKGSGEFNVGPSERRDGGAGRGYDEAYRERVRQDEAAWPIHSMPRTAVWRPGCAPSDSSGLAQVKSDGC
ncbi:MAG TPA: OmpA family protein [Sphingomicrobium sp.]|nr:OmpA family protein [Sphingomicrobium sp.]